MIPIVLFGWPQFSASLGILPAHLARSEGQTAGLRVISTKVLAALGGFRWPVGINPAWMQKFALLLSTGWTTDAPHKLMSLGFGPLAALPHATALILAALVAGGLGTRTVRYL